MFGIRELLTLRKRYNDNLVLEFWQTQPPKKTYSFLALIKVCNPKQMLRFLTLRSFQASLQGCRVFLSSCCRTWLCAVSHSLSTSKPSWGGSSAPGRLVFRDCSDSREDTCRYLAFCPWEVGESWSYLFIFSRTNIIESLKYWNRLFMEIHQGCAGLGFTWMI